MLYKARENILLNWRQRKFVISEHMVCTKINYKSSQNIEILIIFVLSDNSISSTSLCLLIISDRVLIISDRLSILRDTITKIEISGHLMLRNRHTQAFLIDRLSRGRITWQTSRTNQSKHHVDVLPSDWSTLDHLILREPIRIRVFWR